MYTYQNPAFLTKSEAYRLIFSNRDKLTLEWMFLPNHRINSDWQNRSALLPAGYPGYMKNGNPKFIESLLNVYFMSVL